MSRAKVVLTVGLAAVLVGGPAGVGYAAYQHDAAMRGLLPAGTRIGGVDVSKLDRASALSKVIAEVERDFDRPASVTIAGNTYTTTLRTLGATHDAQDAVDRAFRAASSGNWVTRGWHRIVDGSSAPREDVTVTDYAPSALDALADRAAAELDVAPVDGGIRQAGGWLQFTNAKAGQAVDRAATVAALREALADGLARSVDLTPVPAKASPADKAILVRTGENKLYLYERGRIVRTYGVATGSPRYATPTGRYEITLKRYRPTWVNPWSPWSMNEPARIGPGPRNPLGTRALNLSAPGIRIHGTPAPKSIGYSVSHGCIRMRMPDVEALYPLVDKGTPVFIVKAGPPRLPGTPVPAGPVADGG